MTDTKKESEYIFTFGVSSPNAGKFVAIIAKEYYDARSIMVANFGDRWAFQYPNRGMAGVDKWGLTELVLDDKQKVLPRRPQVIGRTHS